MTDLILTRGDSRNYLLEFKEDDGVTVVDITDSVVKMAAKPTGCETNDDAIFILRSYDNAEVEITDAINGEATAKLLADHTVDAPVGDHVWDVELTRRGATVTTAGTAAVTNDSGDITISGIPDILVIKRGDIIQCSSANSENTKNLTITQVDPLAGTISVDYTKWVTESGMSYTVYRGDRKTPTGLSGKFTINQDVVT